MGAAMNVKISYVGACLALMIIFANQSFAIRIGLFSKNAAIRWR